MTSAPSMKSRFSRNAVTRATTLTRLIASIRPRNSLVSVTGRLVASTTPTAGGPAGASLRPGCRGGPQCDGTRRQQADSILARCISCASPRPDPKTESEASIVRSNGNARSDRRSGTGSPFSVPILNRNRGFIALFLCSDAFMFWEPVPLITREAASARLCPQGRLRWHRQPVRAR